MQSFIFLTKGANFRMVSTAGQENVDAYIHTYILTYIHTYMHACMHACIHTYIHTPTTQQGFHVVATETKSLNQNPGA